MLLVGLGKARNPARDRDGLRVAAARAARAARTCGAKSLALSWPLAQGPVALAAELLAVTEGASLGVYRFDKYLTERKPLKLGAVRLLLDAEARKLFKDPAQKASLEAALDEGRALADATCLARDLVNEPAGALTPRALAAAAEEVAKRAGSSARSTGAAGSRSWG